MAKQNLGMVTAYAYAVMGGYEGTEAEFEALLGNIATDLEEIENLTVIANTLPAGSAATASYDHGVLTLGIPKGDKGDTGAGATVAAGTTTTGAPGTNASVVNAGTAKDAVFNFTIPRGDTGNGIESIYLTGTSGAVKTYTILFTDGNTTTFNVTDGEVTNDALTAILADYAKTDGAYESMTVGNAEQLISSVYVTDDEPYLFRTSGGSADIGDREFDTLVGGSVAWNQKIPNGNFETANEWQKSAEAYTTFSVSNNVGKITIDDNTTNGRPNIYQSLGFPTVGHKYLFCGGYKVTSSTLSSSSFSILWGNNFVIDNQITKNAWRDFAIIKEVTAQSYSSFNFYMSAYLSSFSVNDTIEYRNVMVVDLTQMFGSTIADYIYTLEQGTAGAGVAFFRKYFPKPYYPYDAGTIKSVEGVSAHKTVGFNAWDEVIELGRISSSDGSNVTATDRLRAKNYIPIVPNTSYFFTAESIATQTASNVYGYFYDADKNYITDASINHIAFTTPSNAHYMRFMLGGVYGTTFKNDVCINLSWDGERNGEYEPYVEHSYPLDSSLTLRGIPKLSNGKLYYDGDTYESDGTVKRRFWVVDLGTLTWESREQAGGAGLFIGVMPSSPYNYKYSSVQYGMCSKYTFKGQVTGTAGAVGLLGDKGCGLYFSAQVAEGTYPFVYVYDTAFTGYTPAQVKSAMSGVYLLYELATPIQFTATPFTNPQIVDDFGTEEYVANTIVPVGHITKYTNNLKAKLEMSPESPSGDGDYIVRQTSGTNEYVPLGSTTTISSIIARLEALENA